MGIAPTLSTWKDDVLLLNTTYAWMPFNVVLRTGRHVRTTNAAPSGGFEPPRLD
jgi:hypothetical protein